MKPVIALAHGLTNVSLFFVAPVYPDYLLYLIGIPLLLFFVNGHPEKTAANRMDLMQSRDFGEKKMVQRKRLRIGRANLSKAA